MDGAICHVVTEGTALERFCRKGQRLALLAHHDDTTGWLYPLTSQRPRRKESWVVVRADGQRSWLVTDHGLFALPLASISPTQERWDQRDQIERLVRKHLDALEAKSRATGSTPLAFRGLADLARLPKEDLPVVKQDEAPDDGDLFKRYMESGEALRDVKRRGREGREGD